jgi:hypothetical protein
VTASTKFRVWMLAELVGCAAAGFGVGLLVLRVAC